MKQGLHVRVGKALCRWLDSAAGSGGALMPYGPRGRRERGGRECMSVVVEPDRKCWPSKQRTRLHNGPHELSSRCPLNRRCMPLYATSPQLPHPRLLPSLRRRPQLYVPAPKVRTRRWFASKCAEQRRASTRRYVQLIPSRPRLPFFCSSGVLGARLGEA